MDKMLVSDTTRQTHAAYWTSLTTGALFLIATSEFFLAQIIAQMAWPGYSVSQYDISALGVTECSPYTNGSGGLAFTQTGHKAPVFKWDERPFSLSAFSPVCENRFGGHLHLPNPILFAGSKLSRSLG